jgi:hypothetical protein
VVSERAEQTCTLVRASRDDTVLVRTYCPQILSSVSIYLVLEGVRCLPGARDAIEDWAELHSESEKLRLVTWQWFRDQCGRVLGDLADLTTGERLTDYLKEQCLAEDRPDHYLEILREDEQC